jgi:hypothetical protein
MHLDTPDGKSPATAPAVGVVLALMYIQARLLQEAVWSQADGLRLEWQSSRFLSC